MDKHLGNCSMEDAYQRNMADDHKRTHTEHSVVLGLQNHNFCLYESLSVFNVLVCDNLELPTLLP